MPLRSASKLSGRLALIESRPSLTSVLLRDQRDQREEHERDLYDGFAGGNTWKGYVRVLPKELLRLRSLIARGRAREKVRTRSRTPPEIAFLFSPKFPNELFWKVATYWNPRS